VISKYRIFLLIFVPAALMLAAGTILFQEKNKALSADQFESLLKNQWLLVSLLEAQGAADGEAFRKIADGTGLRISLIRSDGEVLFDTSSDGSLESHADRPEIKAAFAGKPTMAMRRSGTTGTATIYYAEKLASGSALRVAYPAEYYEREERALLSHAFGGLCALAAAAAAFALLVSRRAALTMRELGRAVEAARGGGEAEASFGSECLDGALNSLSAATRRLRELDAEREALNRRLEYILANISDGVILFRGEDILYSNPSAERVLGAEIPRAVSEAGDPALITLLERLATGGDGGRILAGGRQLSVSVAGEGAGPPDEPPGAGQAESGGRVVILHDLSDQEKYGIYKSDLVSNISHELKTPLAVILTASEVTLKDPGMPEDRRAGFLETIRRNVLRLSAILDDLNYLQRLETVDEAAGAEADLSEAMSEALSEAKDLEGYSGKKIELESDGGNVAIYGPHLVSVAANLLANAVKYSKDDLVRAKAVSGGGTVTIEVEDGGPPIPPAERERIFERFYSLSRSRNRDKSGSGLGLSIVKHIAMIYDGEAAVFENGRGGNTFRVRLKERGRLSPEEDESRPEGPESPGGAPDRAGPSAPAAAPGPSGASPVGPQADGPGAEDGGGKGSGEAGGQGGQGGGSTGPDYSGKP
jgi:two-component system phosphate regulon sensor histidine kinase PhoR